MAGEVLKKRREEIGLAVKEVAETLKIRADYVTDIEDDNFEKLPVPVYTVGYIRSYAKFLDVDSEPIVKFYNEHLSQPKSAAIMPIGFSRKKSPMIYSVLAALAVLLIALFAVIHYLPGPKTFESTVRVKEEPSGTAPSPQEKSPSAPAAAAGKKSPAEKKHILVISAEETTWLSIILSDGRREEALLRPGESKTWSFPGSAALRLGNGGGVKIQFDGNDLGTPGATGEVMALSFPENAKKDNATSP